MHPQVEGERAVLQPTAYDIVGRLGRACDTGPEQETPEQETPERLDDRAEGRYLARVPDVDLLPPIAALSVAFALALGLRGYLAWASRADGVRARRAAARLERAKDAGDDRNGTHDA